MFCRCVKYWLKLTRLDTTYYPRKAYDMLLNLHSQDKRNWASEICYVLNTHGFGIVWENQGVGDIKLFMSEFKCRLIEDFKAKWTGKVNTSERLVFYSSLRQSIMLSPYLLNVKHVHARNALVRLRFGMCPLRFRSLRLFDVAPNSPVHCPNCESNLENEIHFMLVCPLYSELRCEYIPTKFTRRPTLSSLSILLASTNPVLSINVALYVYYALKIRLLFIDNM